jgi:DNA-binding NtrC family response regulator
MKRIEPLREVQKSHIIQVLRHTSGDLARTRAILGVSPAELETLLRQHGLRAEQFASKNSATLGED